MKPSPCVTVMKNIDRMKVLQTAAIPVVRAVFRQTLRHEIVLLAASDLLTSTMALQSRLERH